MNQQSVRTFIALEAPDSFRDIAVKLQNELTKFKCRISWTKKAGMHLTLKFLGDIDANQIDAIAEMLEKTASGFSPFEVKLGSPGAFGGKNPRVLWLGLLAPSTLGELAVAIDKAMHGLGFPLENRKFHPHLTLGRVKDDAGTSELLQFLKSYELEEASFTAGEVILFKSELKPSGAVYTPLMSVSLKRKI